MIHLDYRDTRPIYEQVKDGLRKLMVTGMLRTGDKLPSVRALAVELAMVQNLMAAQMELDDETVRKLRYECINEVKRLNGGFTFEDAVSWQSE